MLGFGFCQSLPFALYQIPSHLYRYAGTGMSVSRTWIFTSDVESLAKIFKCRRKPSQACSHRAPRVFEFFFPLPFACSKRPYLLPFLQKHTTSSRHAVSVEYAWPERNRFGALWGLVTVNRRMIGKAHLLATVTTVAHLQATGTVTTVAASHRYRYRYRRVVAGSWPRPYSGVGEPISP